VTLVRQTSTYLVANAASAAFGLLNVVIFTRLIRPADYGVYVVGTALSGIIVAMLFTWLRQGILREEAKADGNDIRGTIILGFVTTCLPIPLLFSTASYLMAMDWRATAAASTLAICVGFFEMSQETLRARLQSMQVLRSTLLRAALVSIVGTVAILFGAGGRLLLLSVAVAYLASTLLSVTSAWRGTIVHLRDPRLKPLFVWGLPLTISMAILAISAMMDRFTVAYLLGAQAAGEYGASVDLVRQALLIPAISASSAFVPIAVRLLANDGETATRNHLNHCLELLLAITLPCCIGYALIASRIGHVVLGPEFRSAAEFIMPIVAISVIVQIIVNQYFHISFFLANKNKYYIANAMATLVIGTAISFVLIQSFGLRGAAWGRLVSEIIGLISVIVLARRAFLMPFPLARVARVLASTAAMALVVAGLDPLFEAWDKAALITLIPTGAIVYAAACWFFDVADMRAKFANTLLRLNSRPLP
jgi:O-antigen/teichoic acid export membrane protein